jgi:hypothetical protein
MREHAIAGQNNRLRLAHLTHSPLHHSIDCARYRIPHRDDQHRSGPPTALRCIVRLKDGHHAGRLETLKREDVKDPSQHYRQRATVLFGKAGPRLRLILCIRKMIRRKGAGH